MDQYEQITAQTKVKIQITEFQPSDPVPSIIVTQCIIKKSGVAVCVYFLLLMSGINLFIIIFKHNTLHYI
jgi:hypothetical protein